MNPDFHVPVPGALDRYLARFLAGGDDFSGDQHDVYTKYLLRSDLEILDQQGRIDLVALGLKTEDSQADPNIDIMMVIAVKYISTRLKKEESKPIETPDSLNQ